MEFKYYICFLCYCITYLDFDPFDMSSCLIVNYVLIAMSCYPDVIVYKMSKEERKNPQVFAVLFFIIFIMNMTHFSMFCVLRSAFMYAWVKSFQDYS